MAHLEVVTSHTWPTDGFPLATLDVRLDVLASRLGLSVFTWEEAGLGSVRGLACRLPSGLVFVLEELQQSIKYSHSKGPNILVDAADLCTQGVDPILSKILEGLGLSRDDVTWVTGVATEQEAARIVEEVRNFQTRSGQVRT